MNNLRITIATGNYDRVQAIADGRVPVEGCDVAFLGMDPEECFYRAFTNKEFDVTELSMSSYMIACSRGIQDYVAIPIFLSRMFRHSAIYIRTDAGIERPEDLKGRQVGVPVYAMTASLWVRGMLSEQYGVKPSDIHWLTGGLEEPGRYGKFPLNLPDDIKVEAIPTDRTLSDMLEKGEITALISAREPSCMRKPGSKIGRLFKDLKTAERDYFEQTRLFPIMHVLGLRRSLAEQHPWLPSSLYKAFLQAKDVALEEMQEVAALRYSLPWLPSEVADAIARMGHDFWPYGFKKNLPELEAMTRWSHEQGLAVRRMDPKELFWPSTLEQARI